MIINTVTNEIYDGEKGIDVIPVHYKRQYIEWQDRGESQGAPVKIYEAGDDLPSTTRDKFNKDRLATILNSDKIYVMEKGEIKDSGNHEDLLIQSEAYKSFYQKQIKSH